MGDWQIDLDALRDDRATLKHKWKPVERMRGGKGTGVFDHVHDVDNCEFCGILWSLERAEYELYVWRVFAAGELLYARVAGFLRGHKLKPYELRTKTGAFEKRLQGGRDG